MEITMYTSINNRDLFILTRVTKLVKTVKLIDRSSWLVVLVRLFVGVKPTTWQSVYDSTS